MLRPIRASGDRRHARLLVIILRGGLDGLATDGDLGAPAMALVRADAAKSEDGWLKRALGAIVPLTIRGKAPTLSWVPKVNAMALRSSTIARLIDLYAQTDPVFAKAFAEGVEIGRVGDAGAVASGGGRRATGSPGSIASSPTPPTRQRGFSPPPKGRASASSATTVGIPTPGKASSRDSWPTTWADSMLPCMRWSVV
jgi:uncharacterized protein (DUF1501 family)